MRLRNDVWLAVLLAVIACLAAALLPVSLAALRAPLALPLVLFVPGFAIVVAALPTDQRSTSEVVLLSVAVSVGVAISSGVILNGIGVRLLAAPWMGVLTAVTVAAAAAATARGHASAVHLPRISLRAREAAALGGALVLLGGAAALGFAPLRAPEATQGATALWLTPAPSGHGVVCVGVISDQLRPATYTVSVKVGRRAPRRFGPITLAPGTRWTRTVSVGPGTPVVVGTLSTSAAPRAAYRRAQLRAWNIRARRC